MRVDDGCGNVLATNLTYVNLYLTDSRGREIRVVVDNEQDGCEGVRIYRDNGGPACLIDFSDDSVELDEEALWRVTAAEQEGGAKQRTCSELPTSRQESPYGDAVCDPTETRADYPELCVLRAIGRTLKRWSPRLLLRTGNK